MGTGGEDTPDRLIEDFAAGRRDLTDGEVERIVRHVAEAGYSSQETSRVKSVLVGMEWEGRLLQRGEPISPGVEHYLKHVVDTDDWPVGTSFEEYLVALKSIVLDVRSGIFVTSATGVLQVTAIGRDAIDGRWTVVGYNPGYGHWATGYKPERKLTHLIKEERRPQRWIRKPKNWSAD